MYRGDRGMDLSKALIGAFTKCPMSAACSKEIQKAKEDEGISKAEIKNHIYAGAKKFGFFESERAIFAKTATALGLIEERTENGHIWWHRHPLVFLVEAADDICYNIVDLEDGFSAGDLSFAQVETLLSALIGKKPNDLADYTEYEHISYLRARAIGCAIEACVAAFQEHYDAIMEGRYSGELMDDSTLGKEFRAIRDVAGKQLFTAPRKTKLEVRGRNLICAVLDGILPAYEALKDADWDDSKLPTYERQLVRAAALDLRDVSSNYEALHAMADFVSGMTDRYALEVAKLVSGNALWRRTSSFLIVTACWLIANPSPIVSFRKTSLHAAFRCHRSKSSASLWGAPWLACAIRRFRWAPLSKATGLISSMVRCLPVLQHIVR